MRVSTRVLYGLRAMCVLAQYHGRGPLSVARIAEGEKISFPYLEQLLNRLRKEAFVKSLRGAKGGYVLTKQPSEIVVGHMVRSLEGQPSASRAPWHDAEKSPASASAIVVANVWDRLQETAWEFLDRLSLQDLVDEAKEAAETPIDHRYTFHI